ncbi:hypothetical protein Taro_048865, partial [Colocasia esculenta]|nr:hypothetical protein [Colocasia esculenta]
LGPPSSGAFEGGIGATSVLESAAQQADSRAQGKTVVRLLSSGRACAGQRRRVVVGVPVASSGSPFSVYVTLGVCP